MYRLGRRYGYRMRRPARNAFLNGLSSADSVIMLGFAMDEDRQAWESWKADMMAWRIRREREWGEPGSVWGCQWAASEKIERKETEC